MSMPRLMIAVTALLLSGALGACDAAPEKTEQSGEGETARAPDAGPSEEAKVLPTVEAGGEGSPGRSWLGPGAEHLKGPPERVVESPKLSVGPSKSVENDAVAKSGGDLVAEKASKSAKSAESSTEIGSIGTVEGSGEATGIGDLGGTGRGGGGEAFGRVRGLGEAEGGGKGAGLGSKGVGSRGAARSRGSASRSAGRSGAKSAKNRNLQQAGQLTAARWSDIEHWDFWTGLFEAEQGEASDWTKHEKEWGIYTRRRMPVRVVAEGAPVADVPVRLRGRSGEVLWRARTDNQGRAELFPSAFSGQSAGETFDLIVGAGESETVLEGVEPRAKRYEVDLPTAEPPEPSLDLMLTVDTTGSMGDELSYLAAELGDVVKRVERRLDRDISLRTSANFYRDRGDAYVVRSNPFTTSVDRVVGQIAEQHAGGGGDFPEAVDRALADSIQNHEWRRRTTARLMFLVMDAPPHGGEAQLERVRQTIRRAAKRGIRVIPVVGSGIDKRTEFLMRFTSIATGGTYVFLTDDSGIGGDHIEPTIGPHDVEKLNDLLVEVIVSYVGAG